MAPPWSCSSVPPMAGHDPAVLVSVLARAFRGGSVAAWVEPDEGRRLAYTQALFGALFDEVFLHRRQIDVDGEPPVAVAVWAPPGTWELTAAEAAAVRERLEPVLGDDVERVSSAFQEVDRYHPAGPHWYLAFLGVEPDRQGQGHGARLLRGGLRRCDGAGEAAYLWTAEARNVRFYERHGFDVLWTAPIRGGPQAWGMWRDPR